MYFLVSSSFSLNNREYFVVVFIQNVNKSISRLGASEVTFGINKKYIFLNYELVLTCIYVYVCVYLYLYVEREGWRDRKKVEN